MSLVGAGRIGTLHARLLAKKPEVKRLSTVDRDPEAAKRLAAQVGVDWSTSSVELAERGIDVMVIASPSTTHAA